MSRAPTKLNRGPRLGALLRFAWEALHERTLVWLKESGHEAIQFAHLQVNQPLWDAPKGLRLTALARARRITKQSMSALVDHLEKEGYVERVADPDDARAVRVRHTARGRRFAHGIRDFLEGVEADWSKRIGARHFEELRTALELLRRSLFASYRAADRGDNEGIEPSPVAPIRPSRLPTRRPSVTTQRTIGGQGGRSRLPGGTGPGVNESGNLTMSRPPTKLDRGPGLGALLRFAYDNFYERTLVWFKESRHEAIQIAHLQVTQPLWDAPKGLHLTALARARRITKQSMSALVDHLEQEGYVERVADPDDARAVRVRLTARGRRFVHSIRDFVEGVEGDWSERIGARHFEQLRTALELLRRSLFASDRAARAADRRDNEGIDPSPLPPIRPSRLPTRRRSVTTQRTIGRAGGPEGSTRRRQSGR
jgi:DNA-binding MarR family transcriptional regulator